MDSFENINDHLVYVKAKSRAAAIEMKDKAKETTLTGKSVVIFFNERYHLYLAPGHDPYQIRKEIDAFLNPPPEGSENKDESKNTPTRDARGKFVGKAKATDKKKGASELTPPPEMETPKKKGFWNSLK